MTIDLREKELRTLAKQMVWVQDELKKENILPYVEKECKEEANRITNILLKKSYDVQVFVQYMEEYKTINMANYMRLYS